MSKPGRGDDGVNVLHTLGGFDLRAHPDTMKYPKYASKTSDLHSNERVLVKVSGVRQQALAVGGCLRKVDTSVAHLPSAFKLRPWSCTHTN